MSRLVFLEWDETELRVLDARTTKHAASAQRTLSIELPESDEGPSSKLADVLSKARLGRADVVVSVGRSGCQLRTLTVPNAPPDELPGMVRFQAQRQFSNLSQDSAIDFVVLRQSDSHGVEVLAAAVSRELIDQIRQTAQRANLNLKRVVLRPFATAALVASTIKENDCVLIVDQLAKETDLTVVVGAKVITTRTVRLSAETSIDQYADMLAGEIRRTIAVVDNLDLGAKVGQVVMLGNPTELKNAVSKLAAGISLPVETLNPFSAPSISANLKQLPDQPGRFASLLGAMLQNFAGETNRIDFFNPRRRTEDHSTKKRLAIYAVLALLVLVGLGFAAYLPLRQMKNKIAELEKTISNEDQANKQAINYMQEVRVVDNWVNDEVVWLDELYYVSYHLPPADRVIVNQMHFRYPPLSKNPTVGMTNRLKGSDTVTDLENSLRDEQLSHIASSKNLKPFSDPERRYDYEVDETITINKSKLRKPNRPKGQPQTTGTGVTPQKSNGVKVDSTKTESSEPKDKSVGSTATAGSVEKSTLDDEPKTDDESEELEDSNSRYKRDDKDVDDRRGDSRSDASGASKSPESKDSSKLPRDNVAEPNDRTDQGDEPKRSETEDSGKSEAADPPRDTSDRDESNDNAVEGIDDEFDKAETEPDNSEDLGDDPARDEEDAEEFAPPPPPDDLD